MKGCEMKLDVWPCKIGSVCKKALPSIGELQNGPLLKRRYCNNPLTILIGFMCIVGGRNIT